MSNDKKVDYGPSPLTDSYRAFMESDIIFKHLVMLFASAIPDEMKLQNKQERPQSGDFA